MTGGDEPGRRTGLRGWAQDASARSAACAAHAARAAKSATLIGEQADRMIARAVARNPEYAERLHPIMAAAAQQRAVIAEMRRSYSAGRPSGQPLPGMWDEAETAAIAELDGQLRDMSVIHDRDRAADGLQDRVVQDAFAAGLTLEDAAGLTTEPEVRWRIRAAADGLDELIRILRDALFPPVGRSPGAEPDSGPS